MYKLYKLPNGIIADGVQRVSDTAFIPLDHANADYQAFKKAISEGAELQNADGQVMTAKEVAAFMETLPADNV